MAVSVNESIILHHIFAVIQLHKDMPAFFVN